MDSDLAQLEIGPTVHSRWLTLARRIVTNYIYAKESTENLEILAKLCVKVYLPPWFHIELSSSTTDGPKFFFMQCNESAIFLATI